MNQMSWRISLERVDMSPMRMAGNHDLLIPDISSTLKRKLRMKEARWRSLADPLLVPASSIYSSDSAGSDIQHFSFCALCFIEGD